MSKAGAWFLLASATLVCLAQPPSSSACLSYEPAVVHIHGMLVRETYPGPPNYESVRRGDRPETYWFVKLVSPVCVNEDTKEPDLNPPQEHVTKIQLVLGPEEYRLYKFMIGAKVTATGTLFGAHTGHHRTPVLLTVRAIEEARR